MQDDLIVRDTRQLQALSNPLRMQMLEHLCRAPLTATLLGQLMDLSPARAHYHLKQLTAAGLAELVETRETSGIVEKFYRAVARRFHLDKTVSYDPGGAGTSQHTLAVEIRSAVAAFERRMPPPGEDGEEAGLPADTVGGVMSLTLTPVRYERLLSRLQALFREFETDAQRPLRGTQVYRFTILAYPDTPLPTDEND